MNGAKLRVSREGSRPRGPGRPGCRVMRAGGTRTPRPASLPKRVQTETAMSQNPLILAPFGSVIGNCNPAESAGTLRRGSERRDGIRSVVVLPKVSVGARCNAQ